MAMTDFALGHALAIQRWSTSLAVEAAKKQYFAPFIGTSQDDLITLQNELNKGAGEKVTIGLQMKLVSPGIEGDAIIEGHATGEEALTFWSDYLFIDQLRKSTKSKGKMSEQRVPYDLRAKGRDALAVWWAEEMDEQLFCYLSGCRGESTMHNPTTWTGRANNALTVPDVGHLVYGGSATAYNNITNADKFELSLVEKLVAKAETTDPMMQPFMIGGAKKFVLLMHTFQAFDLRTSTTTNDWLDITKTTDSGRGDSSKLYTGKLGEYADVILHKHRNVIRHNDVGAGVNLPGARALFMGAQAGLMAYGQDAGPNRYSWNEDKDDRGNALAITAGTIFGIKKTRFNGKDWGVVAVDTYSADPTT